MDININDWKEFEVKDLFEKASAGFKNPKLFKKENHVSEIKDEEFNLPLVNAKDGNNGVMYYGRKEEWDYVNMSIDIVSDGAISTGNVYPQIDDTSVLYNAYLIKLKNKYKKGESKNCLIFLTTVLKKEIKAKYGYENKATWGKASKEKIKLPSTFNQSTNEYEPDWDFMERFIQERKETNQEKLEHLKGLKNNAKPIDISDWKEFEIEKLFDVEQSKGDIQFQKSPQGDIPLISSGNDENNSIVGYISEGDGVAEKYNAGNITIDMFGSANYQTKDFYAVSHGRVTILKPNFKNNKATSLFIVACLNKKFKPIFSYKNMCTMTKLKKEKIKLPAIYNPERQEHEPDWEYMEEFIRNRETEVKERLRSLI